MDTVVELEGGRSIRYTAMNAREVFLRHHSLHDVKLKKDGKKNINGIKIEELIVKVGDIIMVRLFDKHLRPFKIKAIKKSSNQNMYILYSTILTKSSRWVMPMLRRTNETQTTMKYNSNFINCYVGTKEEGYLDNIYLVYRYSGDPEYQKFEYSLERHELFDRRIDIDKYHVMYIFNMTSEMKNNFQKFKQGLYSKFTEDYKKKVLQFIINPALVKESDIPTTITYGVLYKTDEQLKRIEKQIGNHSVNIKGENLELYSIPIEEEEVYNGDIEIPLESTLELARIQKERGEI